MALVGRGAERVVLDALLADLHTGSSGVLVLSGEAGIGKTALLDDLANRVADARVVRVSGVESEVAFAFAALHQVCTPISDRIVQLPAPQQSSLRRAFGSEAGPPPDHFLIGLAILGLLSDAADDRPLLLLIDDQQWLDDVSAQILAFVARRLRAEPVGIVFTTRSAGPELAGLSVHRIGALGDDESAVLLASVLEGPIDVRVRDRLIAESHGNPLALLELPRSLTRDELAGGFGPPGVPTSHNLEETFRRQLQALPRPTKLLLALAAADPAGEPTLFWKAAKTLQLTTDDASAAIEAGLLRIDSRVQFRHPLVRSTAYRGVPLSDRQIIHRALALAIDPAVDPVRRAWHRGHAAVGPDDTIADELQTSADLVMARGGIAAAAAFLERASMLAEGAVRRADLALSAALAKAQAGVLDGARELLALAEAAPLSEPQRAEADLVRSQLAFIVNRGNDAGPLLLAAARRLHTAGPVRARDIYLDALLAAIFAGKLASDGGVLEVSEAAVSATTGLEDPRSVDLLLDGMCTQHSRGFDKGLAAARQGIQKFGTDLTIQQELRWMFLACVAAAHLWDLPALAKLAERYLLITRETGVLSELPLALSCRYSPMLFSGQLDHAARAVEELDIAIEAMGNNMTAYGAISLAAFRGEQSRVHELATVMTANALRRGEGIGLTVVQWATSVLYNSFGDYRRAFDAGLEATSYPGDCTSSGWAMVELVEAASRIGESARARETFDQLSDMTTASGALWGLAVETRSRALLSPDDTAEQHYIDAVRLSDQAGLGPDLARAHLVYGEWLRRQRRRVDARAELNIALTLFDSMGLQGFSERARRELTATGQQARKRTVQQDNAELTAQEAQIARLARDGLSNPEIGARLFISARTVQYHLSKVFTKLTIRSRNQLGDVLSD